MLVDKHCEAITADLARFYPGVRIGDLFTGRLTYLELGALLNHLPPESAYRTARRDAYTDEQLVAMTDPSGKHGPWSHTDLLLAAVFDAVQALAHIQVARGGVKQDPPEPLRRPGVVTRRREVNPQAVAYLDRIRQRHAEQVKEAGGG